MVLSVGSLDVGLGGKPVLKGVSFDIQPGEFVGLIGPNGAGKSTLLRSILGLIPSHGSILLDGFPAHSLDARSRAAKIAYLAQDREIAWAVPVELVVSLGRIPHRQSFAALSKADRTAVEQAMQRMDVDRFRDRVASTLSGGERARVLIARTLAQNTPLLLADEPTGGLDPSHQIALMRLFGELANDGKTVIASLHDLGLAARWCSRLLLVNHGRIVADGPPDVVLTPERLRDVYGIEAFFGNYNGGRVIHPLDLA